MTEPIFVPHVDTEPVGSVTRCLQLRPLGSDRFSATSLPQRQRIYGGQILAQAILGGGATVDYDVRQLHSLHAYFLRGGDPNEILEFNVTRTFDGRSFANRFVECRQGEREIAIVGVNFQRPGEGENYQSQMPTVPGPNELRSALKIFRAMHNPVAKYLGQTAAFDVRHVQKNLYTSDDPSRATKQQLWMRIRHPMPSNMAQIVDRALLAYVVDQVMLEPALRTMGLCWMTPDMSLASLDHAMWFHRNFDINQWLLFCGEVLSVSNARATARVEVYTEHGILIATAVQEGMIRVPTEVASGRY